MKRRMSTPDAMFRGSTYRCSSRCLPGEGGSDHARAPISSSPMRTRPGAGCEGRPLRRGAGWGGPLTRATRALRSPMIPDTGALSVRAEGRDE